jgi:hypothetical protein
MLNEKHEGQARRLQKEINQLEARQEKAESAKDRAGTELAAINPRLWDQHMFLLWLGGDRAIHEQVRPLRRQIRQSSREIRRTGRQRAARERQIDQVIHIGLKHASPAYRAILAHLHKAEIILGSCARLLHLVDEARKRIDEAVADARPHLRDEESRAAADSTANEVADQIRAIRSHAASLSRKARWSPAPFEGLSTRSLASSFPGSEADFKSRVRAFKAAGVALQSIGEKTDSLSAAVGKRMKTEEGNRIRLIRAERKRIHQACLTDK